MITLVSILGSVHAFIGILPQLPIPGRQCTTRHTCFDAYGHGTLQPVSALLSLDPHALRANPVPSCGGSRPSFVERSRSPHVAVHDTAGGEREGRTFFSALLIGGFEEKILDT